jgi:hypothetical protein
MLFYKTCILALFLVFGQISPSICADVGPSDGIDGANSALPEDSNADAIFGGDITESHSELVRGPIYSEENPEIPRSTIDVSVVANDLVQANPDNVLQESASAVDNSIALYSLNIPANIIMEIENEQLDLPVRSAPVAQSSYCIRALKITIFIVFKMLLVHIFLICIVYWIYFFMRPTNYSFLVKGVDGLLIAIFSVVGTMLIKLHTNVPTDSLIYIGIYILRPASIFTVCALGSIFIGDECMKLSGDSLRSVFGDFSVVFFHLIGALISLIAYLNFNRYILISCLNSIILTVFLVATWNGGQYIIMMISSYMLFTAVFFNHYCSYDMSTAVISEEFRRYLEIRMTVC